MTGRESKPRLTPFTNNVGKQWQKGRQPAHERTFPRNCFPTARHMARLRLLSSMGDEDAGRPRKKKRRGRATHNYYNYGQLPAICPLIVT